MRSRSTLTISTSTLAGCLLAGCLLAGCKARVEYPACIKDAHCEGESCIDGLCQNCEQDGDCGAGRACVEFRCETAGAGGGCSSAAQCDPGLICVEADCRACTEASQCATGVCSESGRCEPLPCATDDACPIDQICDGGQCIHAPLPPGEAGSSEPVCGISTLHFAFDSAKLTPNNQELLAQALPCFEELLAAPGEGVELVIEAHADALGDEAFNTLLSERRGATVREFLSSRGLPEDRIRVVGEGAREARGTDERSRARDRRVVLTVPEQ